MNAKRNSKRNIKVLISLAAVVAAFGCFLPGAAFAAGTIYRSVGPSATDSLAAGTSNSLTISGTTATFASALPNNIGVGDVLQYDDDADGDIDADDSLVFIHGRTSSTQFTVKTASNGNPVAVTGDMDWRIFRAYTSLANALAGTENTGIDADLRDFDSGARDLVSNDEQWHIACYANGTTADEASNGILISGWTTNTTHYVKIYTPTAANEVGASQRHGGVWNTGKYRLECNGNGAANHVLKVEGVNVKVDGLQIFENEAVNTLNAIYAFNVVGEAEVSNNIIRGQSPASIGVEVAASGAQAGVFKVWNNIVYNFGTAGIKLTNGANNIIYAYNNTVYGDGNFADGCYYVAGGTYVVKNNVAQNCAIGFFGDSASFDATSNYNLTDDDGSGGSDGGANSQLSTVLTFAGAGNYHLAATDSAAIGQGTNLSADANLNFSTDIDGTSRGASWDIGADEYQAGDTTAPTVFNINSDKANGTYGAGEVIDIDVTFSEAVTSATVVTVTLETGATDRTCTFAISNSSTGTCNYTVQAGDSSADLTVNSISGTIADQAGNPMVDYTPTTNLATNKAIVIDTTAPTRTNAGPSGTLAAGTTSTSLSITTNEAATCKYSTSAGTSFAAMASTFGTTGGTSHSSTVSGLANGGSYSFYVRCSDGAGNANSSDTTISFVVAAGGGGGDGGDGGSGSSASSSAEVAAETRPSNETLAAGVSSLTFRTNNKDQAMAPLATYTTKKTTYYFSGNAGWAYGWVAVYEGTGALSLKAEVPIDANGNWSAGVRVKKKGTRLYRFVYKYPTGEEIKTSDIYKVKYKKKKKK